MAVLSRRHATGVIAAGALVSRGLSAPAFADAPPRLASQPIDRLDLPWWRKRFEEKQARLRQGDVDFMFIGDSIVQQFEYADPDDPRGNYGPVWNHFYGRRKAVNLGFVGDTTASLLWRLRHGELDHVRPRAVAMLIGANNYGAVHWGAEPTIAGIAACLDEVARRVPTTHVVLVSVLPSDRGPWVAEQTAATNKGLAERYGHEGSPVTYVDVTAVFTLPSGATDSGKYIDPVLKPPQAALHPSPAGMAALCAAIEPALSKWT